MPSYTCQGSGVNIWLMAGLTEMHISDSLELQEPPLWNMVNFAIFSSSTFLNGTIVYERLTVVRLWGPRELNQPSKPHKQQ